MFLLLAWQRQGREGERIPLKEDTSTSGYASTSTNIESEMGPQSALAWPCSLPPFEEFIQRNEVPATSLPPIPRPESSFPFTSRLTLSGMW